MNMPSSRFTGDSGSSSSRDTRYSCPYRSTWTGKGTGGSAPSEQPGPRGCGSSPPMKGEPPPSSTLSVGQARKMVEQLKIEASLCRVKVSKAAAELLSYCEAHACEDPLLTPVPTSENPFREKKFFCALL
ncbi:guanine nucleotide-binding protein G(I)/G(S)/G(O) subunit gamma-3-like [Chiroxiphia lanceolata]|uniref:guanine nucleotide-binding protein G(I)/G(S)/G(O) subunit gamma-3-like n=1 Tax=Chiroxiphia lanceolata TaxID=296741 RepID=UPI0013CEC0C7|nr:guanine nucleotide-binding protein G(I)/G(S)/G(O) subunit gamma-3-like [Chiroxiphia lanceolata]